MPAGRSSVPPGAASWSSCEISFSFSLRVEIMASYGDEEPEEVRVNS
jgi:hypothetical protein